jgi:hemolysin III
LHLWAFLASLPAGVVLLGATTGAPARAGAGVFAGSLAAMFATSATYHRARGQLSRALLRRADHAVIYLLIAGTYTPVCLIGLPPAVGVPLLVSVWVVAAVGIGCKLLGGPRLMRGSSVLYIVVGWAGVVALPWLVGSFPPAALALLVAGGALYTVGVVILYRRRPDPLPSVFGYHEVWHALTVVAAAAHFAMVWLVASGPVGA